MKRSKILIGLGILMLVTLSLSASAETVDLATLEYLGTGQSVFLPGNVSLYFNGSETGAEDVVITNSEDYYYPPPANISIYVFESKNITYDWSFVNNTKSYYYKDINNLSAGITYRVLVDYSSVQVPFSPWKNLEDMLAEQNATIANLTENISILQNNITLLNVNISELNSQIEGYKAQLLALQTAHNTLVTIHEEYVTSTESLITSYWALVNTSMNQTLEINMLQAKIWSLEQEILDWKGAFEGASGVWSTGYTLHGKEEFHFNGAWFLIGGLIFVLILFVVILFLKGRMPTTLIGRIKPGRGTETWTTPREERSPEEVEDFPDVEKSILREISDEDIQNIAEESRSSSPPSSGNNAADSSSKKKKKKSWWDSPAGKRRREELKQQMREVNKRKNE